MASTTATSPEVYLSVEEIAAEIDYQKVLLISLDDSQEDRVEIESQIKAEITKLGKQLKAIQQEQHNPIASISSYAPEPDDDPFALSPTNELSRPDMRTLLTPSASSTPDSATSASAMNKSLSPSIFQLPTRKRPLAGHLDVTESETKFRRTSPSPHIIRSITPSSTSGYGHSKGGDGYIDLTVSDDNVKQELAKVRQRQEEAERKANRERDDAEYARQLQDEYSESIAPTLGSGFSQYAVPSKASAFDKLLGRRQPAISQTGYSNTSMITPAFNSNHHAPSSDSDDPSIITRHVPGAFQESESDSEVEIMSTNAITHESTQASFPNQQRQSLTSPNAMWSTTPTFHQPLIDYNAQMVAMQPELFGGQPTPGVVHVNTLANSETYPPHQLGMNMQLGYPSQYQRGPGHIFTNSPSTNQTMGIASSIAGVATNNGQNADTAGSSENGSSSNHDPLAKMIMRTSYDDYGSIIDIHGNPVDSRMAELNNALGGRLGEINDYVSDPRRTAHEIQALLENIRPDVEIPKENREGTPDGLKYSLYEHQKLALTWLRQMEEGTNKGGILADDMGLGKTISALALILSRPSQDRMRKTTLIVGPVALVRQWEREIQTKVNASHRLSTFLFHSGKKATWENLRSYDIVLTTYGTIGAELKRRHDWEKKCSQNPNLDQNFMKNRFPFLGETSMWYRIILDEAQCIKNKNTKAAQGCCLLKSLTRFCLTGTPMMNGVHELYSLIHFLRIKPYNDHTKFVSDFGCLSRAGGGRGSVYPRMEENAMKRLQAVLKAILLRRTKTSQIDGKPILTLPDKTEEVVHAVFNEDEQAYYTALETKTRLQFNKYLKANTVGKNYSNILVLLLRLRQAACHPHLIMDFEEAPPEASADDMIALAKTLTSDVIRRLIESTIPFECPVCYDPVPNPRIVIPCGHETCSECLVKITGNVAQAIAEGDEAGEAKCPTCRGKVDIKKVIDYLTFKGVHMKADEDAPADKPEDDSDSLDYSSDTDDQSEEIDSDDDIRNFIVPDGYVSSNEAETDGEDEVKNEYAEENEGIAENTASNDFGSIKKEEGGVKNEAKDEEDDDFLDIKDIKPFKKSEPASHKRNRKSKIPRHKRHGKGKSKNKDKGKSRASPKEPVPKHASLGELKKAASKSVEGHRRYMRYLRKNWVSSAKVDKCLELLRETDPDVKTIIFSQFTTLLDLVEIPIRRENWGFTRYDGSMSADARNQAVVRFTDDPRCKIMLVSLKAGNAGLNLVAASQVIILDPFWNPFIEMQAVDRAHRIGQQKSVKVHRILVAKTVEDRIIELQNKKRSLVEAALSEKASQGLGRLGRSELIYLFNGHDDRETAARPPQPFDLGADTGFAASASGSGSSS